MRRKTKNIKKLILITTVKKIMLTLYNIIKIKKMWTNNKTNKMMK